jgi:hypothetical protein
MALTGFQRTVCRLIAANRVERGESYVAGGTALNLLAGGSRISRDIDIFHDTNSALEAAWADDRALLAANGYDVRPLRERPAYIEAVVAKGGDSVLLEWTRDSAYRFFPLVRHEDLGLALHPFDLATNKVLALVGRLEIRDWLDTLMCHARIQPLGYLAWAACGKDPGFSPAAILEQAARSGRYTQCELDGLAFAGPPPDLAAAARTWHAMLGQARGIVEMLPADEAGKCVLDRSGLLYTGTPDRLLADLAAGALVFHEGSIRGAFPVLAGE